MPRNLAGCFLGVVRHSTLKVFKQQFSPESLVSLVTRHRVTHLTLLLMQQLTEGGNQSLHPDVHYFKAGFQKALSKKATGAPILFIGTI